MELSTITKNLKIIITEPAEGPYVYYTYCIFHVDLPCHLKLEIAIVGHKVFTFPDNFVKLFERYMIIFFNLPPIILIHYKSRILISFINAIVNSGLKWIQTYLPVCDFRNPMTL